MLAKSLPCGCRPAPVAQAEVSSSLGPLAPNQCFHLSVCLASLTVFLYDFFQGALLDKEHACFQGCVTLRKINLSSASPE